MKGYIAQGMKNWISTTISIVALGVAIVAMAKVAPTQELDFDYYGAIIGVLSFLVTLLMGYQIYTVINVKEELKEVQKLRGEIEGIIRTKVLEVKEQMNDELVNVIPLLVSIDLKDPADTIMTALEIYGEAQPGTLAQSFSDDLIAVLMNNVVTYKEEDRIKYLQRIRENAKYETVTSYYAHLANQDAEQKKDYEGVEQLFVRLINMYMPQ